MQINSINSYNTNFNGVARARLTNGSTAVLNVVTDKAKIKSVSCKIWQKGKCLNNLDYKWKNGIQLKNFYQPTNKICKELGLLEEKERKLISNAIFDAYMEDMIPVTSF